MTPEIWWIILIVFLWILAGALVLLGIVGTVLPGLAGSPFVFFGLLIVAWIDRFEKVGWVTLTVLGVLTLLPLGIDYLAVALGAKRLGASREAVVGAIIGVIAGIFSGLIGLILFPFLGAAIGEYLHQRDWVRAGKVGIGTWLGLVLGVGAKLAVIFAMIGIFLTAFLF